MVPDGFLSLRAGPVQLVVAPGLETAARALGLLEPGGVERLLREGEGESGRGPTAVVALPGEASRLHLRPLRHGGWLASLTRDRWLGLARPLAELAVTDRLARAGAPVPRPALVVGRRGAGPFWSAAVGTLHEEGTRDALRFLAAAPSAERVRCAAAAVGRAIRRLHDAGGSHPDLHLKNLLLRERDDASEALVIDLDRARVRPGVPPRERLAQLMRLVRSLAKRGVLARVRPEGLRTALDAYTGGDPALRRALLAHLPRERIRLSVHALGYRLG